MPSFKTRTKLFRFMVLASPLLMAACGDGWEMVRVTDFPYGNKRTAGTGVAYVRAKMLPKKELNLEPAPVAAPAMSVPPAKVEEIFRKGQNK